MTLVFGCFGRLFLNEYGHALVTDTGSDTVGREFKKVARRAKLPVTFQQFRDTSAQAIKDASMRSGRLDPALIQLFLAHRDHSTAAYYLSDDPKAMVTNTLDTALQQLEEYYGLDDSVPLPMSKKAVSKSADKAGKGRQSRRKATGKTKPKVRRRLVRRDASGHIVDTKMPKRGRPPTGYRLEELEPSATP